MRMTDGDDNGRMAFEINYCLLKWGAMTVSIITAKVSESTQPQQ